MSILLSDVAVSRNNNFNLIRFIAATMVIVSHSYPLTGGGAEPLGQWGFSLGHIAVDIFFITSGFLVTGSLIRRGSLLAFAAARIMRIYPALIVAVLFCAFILGLVFTTQKPLEYLLNESVYDFIINNSLLIAGPIHYSLPGVFESNPYKLAVNGSLWTLPWEVRMYALVACVWFILRFFPNSAGTKVFGYAIVGIGVAALVAYLVNHVMQFTDSHNYIYGTRFIATFFIGAAFYIFKDYIRLSWPVFLVTAGMMYLFSDHLKVLFIIYSVTIPYLVLCLAYLPTGLLLKFNKFGDYSYGIYIYAFPVQQAVAALYVGVGVLEMFFLSFLITLLLAIFSWHVIEKPTLHRKDFYIPLKNWVYNKIR